MGSAPVMIPKELVLLSVPPRVSGFRLTKLKTFVASPRNWNFTRSLMAKSRKRDISMFLYPGPSSELALTKPSRPDGPPPAGQPAVPTRQYTEVSNHSVLLPSTLGVFPGMILGRSLLSPSKLSSLPLVMLKGLPLRIEIVEDSDQPFRMVRVTRLK